MPKDKKGGLAILIAGKPTKGPAADEDEYEGEDVPVEESEEPEAPIEDEYAESEAAYPEFDIPAELDFSDMEEGDEKEVVAVIRKKGEATACIVSVDGVDLAGGELPVEEELPTEAPPAPPAPPMGPPPAPMGPPGAAIGQRAMRGGLM